MEANKISAKLQW